MELIPQYQRFFNQKTQTGRIPIANTACKHQNITTRPKGVSGYLYEGSEWLLSSVLETVNHLASQTYYCPANPDWWKQRHYIHQNQIFKWFLKIYAPLIRSQHLKFTPVTSPKHLTNASIKQGLKAKRDHTVWCGFFLASPVGLVFFCKKLVRLTVAVPGSCFV